MPRNIDIFDSAGVQIQPTSSPSPVFINKVLLGHNPAHVFRVRPGLLLQLLSKTKSTGEPVLCGPNLQPPTTPAPPPQTQSPRNASVHLRAAPTSCPEFTGSGQIQASRRASTKHVFKLRWAAGPVLVTRPLGGSSSCCQVFNVATDSRGPGPQGHGLCWVTRRGYHTRPGPLARGSDCL